MPLNRRHIPNLITVARAAMAAAFFVVLSLFKAPDTGVLWLWIALVLFVAAAATDAFDGWLARRWKVVSLFGRIMDPLCDKILVLGGFMVLAGPHFAMAPETSPVPLLDAASGVYTWVVVVLLARELTVTAIRSVAESQGAEFAAKTAGKVKMVVQSGCIPIVMFLLAVAPPQTHAWAFWVNHTLVWLTVVVTLVSAVPYIKAIIALERAS